MAEVVLRLTAESAQALSRMKEFTRGVEDAWKSVRAGDPILQGSSVKVLDLTRAKGEATRATDQWRDALGQLPGPIGHVATQTSRWISLLRGPAGLAVGLTAAAAAGIGFAKSMANDIERLENLSTVTGLSVAALETFEHVAKQAGEAPEALVQGLGKVNTAIADVIKGSDSAHKSFDTIGVDLRGLVQSGASTEQILEATAKAMAAIPDPTRQAAAMADIFGVRSRALQIALQQVAKEGIGPLIAEMKRLGIVTSEETIAAAKHVDEMADRFDQGIDRMIKKLKQYAVEAVSDFAKVAKITADLFGPGADPAQAGRVVAGQLAHEIVRPGVLAAGPQTRTTAPTSAELAAAKAATELALKQQIDGHEEIRKSREELAAALSAIDDRERAQRLAAEEATQKAIAAIWIQAVDDYEARQNERQALDTQARADRLALEIQTNEALKQSQEDLQVALSAIDQREREQKLAILTDTSTGRIRLLEEEREKVRAVLDQGVADVQTTEDLKLRILELTVARDLELEQQKVDRALEVRIAAQQRMNGLLELRVTAERRAADAILTGQMLAAHLAGDTWAEFGARFGLIVNAMPTAMDQAMSAIQGSIQAIGQAFEESVFQLIKGNLDDFDDIWKAALDAVLKQIIAFLASEAVQALIKLGTDIAKGLTSGSGSGDSGFQWDDPSTWFQTKRGSGNRVEIEQQATEESKKRLSLEQQRTATLPQFPNTVSGANIGRQVGSLGGPIGMGVGIGVGAAVGLARDIEIQGFLDMVAAQRASFARHSHALDDLTTATDEGTAAATQAAAAAMNAAVAQNGLAEDLDPATAAANQAAQAARDLTAAQTDLAVETHDLTTATAEVTAATTEATTGLDSFSDGLGDLGKGITDAVAAAEDAAGRAASAATAASDSAADARGFAGTGPGQSPGPVGDPGGAGGKGGTSGGAADAPDPDQGGKGQLHGGWAGGVRGYAPGGWVHDGVWGRDSVMARLARGEFVLNAGAANYAPRFTEALNRDPARALAGVAGSGGGQDGTGPAILGALVEQNRLIKRQNDLLERNLRAPGRGAGASV